MGKKQPSGTLQISHEVIATIASVAAQEIEGVSGLAQHAPGIRRNPLKNNFTKPVDVVITNGMTEIDIGVTLKHGAKINEVCANVQNAVKDNVQTMTGMAVGKVNVFVARVSFPEAEPTPS